ncbi:zf-HC2 domain-containing protein [candidate division KSB1 bacterium]|nr:zf-HC2 domain-containing protein [candidate division KSB1 bacterium]RQW08813.1 MAG: zf-HC2 domain-containing protein [candidate division KSB1 bacterium]
MRHHKIKKKLSEFLDGRLSSNEDKMIKEHLAHCQACQATLNSFRQLRRCKEADYEMNPFFAQRVLALVRARRSEGFWQVFDFIPRPVIVTGLVLSVITLTIFATPLYQLTNDRNGSELAMLYAESNEMVPVTDDQALAIVFQAQEANATGE